MVVGIPPARLLKQTTSVQKHTILRIKGSGCDLKTITEQDFSGLYLEQLLPLLNQDNMSP